MAQAISIAWPTGTYRVHDPPIPSWDTVDDSLTQPGSILNLFVGFSLCVRRGVFFLRLKVRLEFKHLLFGQ